MKDRTGIDDSTLGGLLLLVGVAALVGMQAGGRLIDRIGSAPTVAVAMTVLALVLPFIALAESPVVLAGVLALLGLANGVVDVAQNAQASWWSARTDVRSCPPSTRCSPWATSPPRSWAAC